MTCLNLKKSIDFYVRLGFEIEKEYSDENIEIQWLTNGKIRLEFFHFSDLEPLRNEGVSASEHYTHRIKKRGITHIALQTNSIETSHKNVINSGITCTEITQARIGDYRYFFINDPDENLIEFIGDIEC
jgi:catechol 2,3-dioxygenase-like lactoylglutathione lyase family enzyme